MEQNRQAGNRPNPEQWREITEHGGVGFLIKNALVASITDINPINGRIIKATFDTTPRLHVFSVYAPQAGRPTTEIEDFYAILAEEIHKLPARDIYIFAGDYNATLYQRMPEEEHIGPHIFAKTKSTSRK